VTTIPFDRDDGTRITVGYGVRPAEVELIALIHPSGGLIDPAYLTAGEAARLRATVEAAVKAAAEDAPAARAGGTDPTPHRGRRAPVPVRHRGGVMQFFLGSHMPNWLEQTSVPLFISARRLRDRKTLPKASGPWALDSGGFSEITLFGRWMTPAMQYSSEVRHWMYRIPGLQWAAIQDWMCEPFVVEKTGMSVREHQRLTIHSWNLLRQLAPDLPWAPVLQGYKPSEYIDHLRQYEDAGTDLRGCKIVGVGSICRRQNTGGIGGLVRELHEHGLKLHGFGLKLTGLREMHPYLVSADSMAWSFDARRADPLPGCTHRNCNSCLKYALRWRGKVLRSVSQRQPVLF